MKNLKMNIKKGTTLILIMLMLGNIIYVPAQEKEENRMPLCISEYKKKKISNIKDKVRKNELGYLNKKIVDNLLRISKNNGEMSAVLLNQIDENTDTYKVAINEILEYYYEKDEKEKECTLLQQFKKNVTSSMVKKKIQDYEEAKNEREAKNLDYVPGEILVSFDAEVEESDIAKLADYTAKDYEILLDNNFHMDRKSFKKKKRTT